MRHYQNRYVLSACKFLLKTSVQNGLSSFVRGFHSVVARHCLRMMSPKLLEGMICGQSEITDKDIKDLRSCGAVFFRE